MNGKFHRTATDLGTAVFATNISTQVTRAHRNSYQLAHNYTPNEVTNIS